MGPSLEQELALRRAAEERQAKWDRSYGDAGYGFDQKPVVAKKRRRRRSFLEVLLRKVQQPEVILLSVWWLIMLILVVYMAEMGGLLYAIWKPLFVLLSIPVMFFVGITFLTV